MLECHVVCASDIPVGRQWSLCKEESADDPGSSTMERKETGSTDYLTNPRLQETHVIYIQRTEPRSTLLFKAPWQDRRSAAAVFAPQRALFPHTPHPSIQHDSTTDRPHSSRFWLHRAVMLTALAYERLPIIAPQILESVRAARPEGDLAAEWWKLTKCVLEIAKLRTSSVQSRVRWTWHISLPFQWPWDAAGEATAGDSALGFRRAHPPPAGGATAIVSNLHLSVNWMQAGVRPSIAPRLSDA